MIRNVENSEWQIQNGIICKTNESGFIVPTTEALYSSVFEGKYSEDVNESDVNELKKLVIFSKYPATLKIVVQSSEVSNYSIELSICAFSIEGKRTLVEWENKIEYIIIEEVWYPFDPSEIEEINSVIKKIDLANPGRLTLGQYLALSKINSEFVSDEVIGISRASAEDNSEEKPFGLKATLYPYQTTGWRWLKFSKQEKIGGILADEMGLGKTIQIIAVLCSAETDSIFPSLIISPSTLLENWRREFNRFAPHIKTLIHQGSDRTGFPRQLKEYDVIITSYDIVIRDSSLFAQLEWKFVVCDEAQAIKNPGTKRSISVKKIPRQIGVAVTGTPIENSLVDLWSLMDFAVPGFLGTKEKFETQYSHTQEGAASLERIISPLILRRKIADVATELPERIVIPQVLELNDYETAEYENIREQTLGEYSSNSALAVLTRLRMFCTHPFLTNSLSEEDPVAYSNKYFRLIEIAEEIVSNQAKMIVFTSYNKMNDIIRNDFANRFGIFSESIDGRTPVIERQNIVDRFSSINGSAVLVLNPVAAGTGLNITAANHVIHYNLEWNPAKEDQASARAHRRGQTLPVTIHRLYYADTVEEAINERLDRKRELAGTAIVGISGEENDYNDILSAIQKSPKK